MSGAQVGSSRQKEALSREIQTRSSPPPKRDFWKERSASSRKKYTRRRPQFLKASIFTPLTKEMSTLLKEMENNNLAMSPVLRKVGGPMGRDLYLHCNYHKANDQYMDECFMLRQDIEALIKIGFLKKFLAKRRSRGSG